MGAGFLPGGPHSAARGVGGKAGRGPALEPRGGQNKSSTRLPLLGKWPPLPDSDEKHSWAFPAFVVNFFYKGL
jgi:hypothetical protein